MVIQALRQSIVLLQFYIVFFALFFFVRRFWVLNDGDVVIFLRNPFLRVHLFIVSINKNSIVAVYGFWTTARMSWIIRRQRRNICLLVVLVFPYARHSHHQHRLCTLSYGIAERWVIITVPAGCFRFDCTLYVCGNFVEWLVTSFFCVPPEGCMPVLFPSLFLLLCWLKILLCRGIFSSSGMCMCSSSSSSESINKNKNTLFNVSFMNKFTLVASFMRL